MSAAVISIPASRISASNSEIPPTWISRVLRCCMRVIAARSSVRRALSVRMASSARFWAVISRAIFERPMMSPCLFLSGEMVRETFS